MGDTCANTDNNTLNLFPIMSTTYKLIPVFTYYDIHLWLLNPNIKMVNLLIGDILAMFNQISLSHLFSVVFTSAQSDWASIFDIENL